MCNVAVLGCGCRPSLLSYVWLPPDCLAIDHCKGMSRDCLAVQFANGQWSWATPIRNDVIVRWQGRLPAAMVGCLATARKGASGLFFLILNGQRTAMFAVLCSVENPPNSVIHYQSLCGRDGLDAGRIMMYWSASVERRGSYLPWSSLWDVSRVCERTEWSQNVKCECSRMMVPSRSTSAVAARNGSIGEPLLSPSKKLNLGRL